MAFVTASAISFRTAAVQQCMTLQVDCMRRVCARPSVVAPQQLARHQPIQAMLPDTPWISASDTWILWTIILAAGTLGIKIERTPIGRVLSGPVCAMLSTAMLTSLGVLPGPSSSIAALQAFVVKLATPLLLLGADLRRIRKQTGQLLQAFLLGTVATTIASTLSFAMLFAPMRLIGDATDGWKLAAALTAKNVGSGLNFVAVANALSISSAAMCAGLAADNLLVLLYFPAISYLADRLVPDDPGSSPQSAADSSDSSPAIQCKALTSERPPSLAETSAAVALAMGIVAMASLSVGDHACLPVATLLTVSIATGLPNRVRPLLPSAECVGKLLLFLFFASVGANSGTFASVLHYPVLLGFGLILYVVHICVMLLGRRVFRLDFRDVLVASNANIGGPATASALATSRGWSQLVTPALLVGTLGNSIGTFVGIGLGKCVFEKFF